jgi:hypothetical protein
MKRKHLLSVLLPLVKMDMWSGLGDIGRWIDKMFTLCLVIVILLLTLFILWLLSKLFGGGARG